nr:hypothetical protein [Tanacetum cinerariifolium]
MAAVAMKHMSSNFAKLDKFESVYFRRWKKKMHFLLSSMSVVYVLTTPISEDGDDAIVEQLKKRAKWDNDDYVYKVLILNVMKQYNEFLGILGRFTQHKMNMDEAIQVSCIIEKLHPSWKDLKHTLKHNKDELTLVKLGSHVRIMESLRGHDNDKLKGNNTVGPQVVIRLPDPKIKTVSERGIECIFVRYAEHSKAFRFFVIEPNEYVSINSIIESKDAIFDENRFILVPRPSLSVPKETEDIGGSVVPEKVIEEVVHQLEPELRKSKRNKTPKDFKHEFQLYLVERTRDEVSDQHSYCFNVEDDPKTFNEAIKSQDGFRQKSRIDYFDTYTPVARISTIRLLIAIASIHNLIIHQMDVKTAFLNDELDEEHAPKQWHQKYDEVVLSNGYLLNQVDKCVYSKFDKSGKRVIIYLYVDYMMIFGTNKVQVYPTKEFLSSWLSMKDMGEADVIQGIKIKHKSNGIVISQSYYIEKAVSQLEYSRKIGCLIYGMTCTRSDIAFVEGKLSSSAIFSAVASLFFCQWELFSLAVGMPCAFYSQQSSPKLDAPAAIKFPE